jgi:hypothetical protein
MNYLDHVARTTADLPEVAKAEPLAAQTKGAKH